MKKVQTAEEKAVEQRIKRGADGKDVLGVRVKKLKDKKLRGRWGRGRVQREGFEVHKLTGGASFEHEAATIQVQGVLWLCRCDTVTWLPPPQQRLHARVVSSCLTSGPAHRCRQAEACGDHGARGAEQGSQGRGVAAAQ